MVQGEASIRFDSIREHKFEMAKNSHYDAHDSSKKELSIKEASNNTTNTKIKKRRNRKNYHHHLLFFQSSVGEQFLIGFVFLLEMGQKPKIPQNHLLDTFIVWWSSGNRSTGATLVGFSARPRRRHMQVSFAER